MTRQEEIVLARMIEMRLQIDGFEDGLLKELDNTYKKLTGDLLNEVKAAKGKSTRIWTNTRLIAMLEEAQIQHGAIIGEMTKTAASGVVESGLYSYKTMNNIVSWDGKVPDYMPVSMTRAQLLNLATEQKLGGKVLNEWIGGALLPDIDSIKSELKAGYIRGDGYSKIVSRLQNELSLSKGSKEAQDMESVVKTYIQSMNVKAQQDVYEANDSVVMQVEWTAIMEPGNVKTGRGTCPRCIALDNQRWDTKDYDRPPCPLHVRCRCMLLPVTKTWREMGFDIDEMEQAYRPWTIRDDRGRIANYGFDKNYEDWFLSQGKSFQDRAVGPRRAELIREGFIDLPDIVDGRGNLRLLKNINFTAYGPRIGSAVNLADKYGFIAESNRVGDALLIAKGSSKKKKDGINALMRKLKAQEIPPGKEENYYYIRRSLENMKDKGWGGIVHFDNDYNIMAAAAYSGQKNGSLVVDTLGALGGGTGQATMYYIMKDSVKLGFNGNVSLYSTPGALGFYRRFSFDTAPWAKDGRYLLSKDVDAAKFIQWFEKTQLATVPAKVAKVVEKVVEKKFSIKTGLASLDKVRKSGYLDEINKLDSAFDNAKTIKERKEIGAKLKEVTKEYREKMFSAITEIIPNSTTKFNIAGYTNDGHKYLSKEVVEKLNAVGIKLVHEPRRAFYNSGTKTLGLHEKTVRDHIFMHEIGHAMEAHIPGYRDAAFKFLNKRKKNYPRVPIKGVPGEYCWEDKFINSYMGKDYDWPATEIISMGLEYMVKDPIKLATDDPEYFEFIIKLMWGEL